MIKNVCIVGGGTAGLISALMLNSAHPHLKITLIESSKIGIIGVGEGSTEHWSTFMKAVGISRIDLIKNTGATLKSGIRFDNWNGDGKTYFHSLSEMFSIHDSYTGIPYTMMRLVGENVDPLKTMWPHWIESKVADPFNEVFAQYHFDTFKLNSYFHKLCQERNITIIDDEIVDITLDENGFVDSLTGVDGAVYNYDFYVDSTGFKRIIINKLGAKWIDCSEQLPMNSAIAFPTGYKEDIPAYTISKAMNAGWRWRIPTQERFGNGYVFCDSFINETQAFDEVQSEFDEPLTIGKKVKFSAGYVDKFWIKNCVTIGLAGMFVEPLEASSIGSTIQMMRAVIPILPMWERNDDVTIKTYNKIINEIATNIVDFIQLHYFVKREDTEFWKWCKHNIKMTEFNQEYLETFKNRFVGITPFFHNTLTMFKGLNYAQVMHGLGLFNTEKIKQLYDNSLSHLTAQSMLDLTPHPDFLMRKYTHREALNEILKAPDSWK